MNRDTILEDVLGIESKAIVLQLGTGTGKTRLAIERTMSINCETVLVVAPRHTILEGWKEEFITWGYEEFLPHVTFTCYASLQNYIEEERWDMVIFDEAHHLSERCRDIMNMMNITNVMFLSATMKREVTYSIKKSFSDLYIYKIGMRETIDEGILPDPTIILMPMLLCDIKDLFYIEVNPKAPKVCPTYAPMTMKAYWEIKKKGRKDTKYILRGSSNEYHAVISGLIDFYKKKGIHSEAIKNKWLKMSGDRLKWFAKLKNDRVKEILYKLRNYRTLTFCCDIEQSNEFGPNSINSKSKKTSLSVLKKFNEGEIKHIQACNMLDEGVNLVDCRIGIFANINSSERIITQRNGRILRHKKPVIILPYFARTREEELVNKMMENYNPELIRTVENLSELTI